METLNMNILTFNLDNGSLGKYVLSSKAPMEFNNKHLICYKEGYTVSLFNKKISAILVCFRKGYMNFSTFLGTIIINKKGYYFNADTTLENIKNILGEPIEEWNDGVEKCVIYCHRGRDVEIVWHVNGVTTLDYVSIE